VRGGSLCTNTGCPPSRRTGTIVTMTTHHHFGVSKLKAMRHSALSHTFFEERLEAVELTNRFKLWSVPSHRNELGPALGKHRYGRL
jgi:hypothetical protein